MWSAYDFARLMVHKILKELKKNQNDIQAISAISEGADSLFAETAISQNISLETVIPFESFSSDFDCEEAQARYTSIRKSSDTETKVRFRDRNPVAYKRSMEWIVFKSNIIIALWDGRELGTVGGTWEAVSLCMKLKKNMVHIDSMNREINMYSNFSRNYSLVRRVSSEKNSRYI